MLRASSAAYCTDAQLQNLGCGDICDDLSSYQYQYVRQFTYNISIFQAVSYSMFVNPSQNIFITAFRGSHSDGQLADEFLTGYAVPYTLNNITSNAVATAYFYDKYEEYLRNDFLSNIQLAAQQYPDYTFYVVGHSLGGALATLAVIDIGFQNIIPKSQLFMYTYGSPRVGDVNLVEAAIASVNQNFRVTHYKDPIPHVPICVSIAGSECLPYQNHPYEGYLPVFNAFHIWPEVFYNTESGMTYTTCDQGESMSCSDQFSLLETQIEDHLHYLGVSTECLGNGPTSGSSDASDANSEEQLYMW
jgi:hypothetical protein